MRWSKELRVSAGDARRKSKNSTGGPSAQQKRAVREGYASRRTASKAVQTLLTPTCSLNLAPKSPKQLRWRLGKLRAFANASEPTAKYERNQRSVRSCHHSGSAPPSKCWSRITSQQPTSSLTDLFLITYFLFCAQEVANPRIW